MMRENNVPRGTRPGRRTLTILLLAVCLSGIAWLAAPQIAWAAAHDVEWGRFQNSAENNGVVTDRNLPAGYSETSLKWGRQMVQGYTTSFTPPLIIDGCLYTASSQNVYKLSKKTGETVAVSDELLLNVGYAMNPITYDEEHNQLYVPILNGRIACLSAEDLSIKWTSREYKYTQTLSPITYRDGLVYTGIWETETDDGVYYALDWETGKTVWEFRPSQTVHQKSGDTPRGFYWAGAYASEKALIFGSDDGQNNTFADTGSSAYTKTAILYSADLKTGDIIDKITEIRGDIRSTIVHHDGWLYFTTKGGWLCKVKLNDDGTFDHDSFSKYTMPFNGMMTASPVVYGGRIYVGVAGAGGQFSADGGHLFAVLRDDEMLSEAEGAGSLLYTAAVPGYPQAAPLLKVEKGNRNKVRLYFTFNAFPGGIYYLEDDLSVSSYDDSSRPSAKLLFRPELEMQQYCISPLCCDRDGTIYIKNDSGYLMAISTNKAWLKDISVKVKDDEVKWSTAFESGLLKYVLRAPAKTSEVSVTLDMPEGVSATVNDKPYTAGGRMPVSVDPEGDRILVTASKTENGIAYKRTYSLTVSSASDDANLSGLVINTSNTSPGVETITSSSAAGQEGVGYDPAFDAGVADYVSRTYNEEKTFLNLWIRKSDQDAKVKVYPVENAGNSTSKGLSEDGTITAFTAANGNIRYPVYWVKNKSSATVKVIVTSAGGNVTKSYNVTLVRGKEHLEVGEEPLILHPGIVTLYSAGNQRSKALTAVWQGRDVTEDCTWESTDPGVASVDSRGNVSAGSAGTAEIWARYSDGTVSKRAHTHIIVEEPQAEKPMSDTESGTYFVKKNIVLSTASSGAKVHYEYNRDGSDVSAVARPKSSSAAFDRPITLGENGRKISYRIRAISAGSGYRNSDTVDFSYTIDLRQAVGRIEITGLGRTEAGTGTVSSGTKDVKIRKVTWNGNRVTVEAELDSAARETKRFAGTVIADLGNQNYAAGTLNEDGSITVQKTFAEGTEITAVEIAGIARPAFGELLPTSAVSLSDGVSAGTVVWKSGDTVVDTPSGEGACTASVELKLKEGYTFSDSCPVRFLIDGKYTEGKITVGDDGSFAVCSLTPAAQIADGSVEGITLEKSELTGLASGISESSLRTRLRSVGASVRLNSGRTLRCGVSWDTKELMYDPDVVSEQEFIVNGKVELPSGVETAGVSLNVQIRVRVEAGSVQDVAVSPAPGTYGEDKTISLSTGTKGASIIYTTSENNDTTVYDKPFLISADKGRKKTVTVKAYAVKNNVRSATKSFVFTIDKTVPGRVTGVAADVSASKKKIVLSWKAVSGADSCRIAWRRAGSSKWSSRDVSGNSLTLKGLSKYGLYEIRCAAKNRAGTGAYSSVYCFVGKTSLKIQAGKKKMTLRMKKTGKASGFRILYSASKSMSRSKKKTTGKEKYTVKGLKPKKYYYVKTSPYRKYKGKTYIGEETFKKVRIK